MKYACFTVGLPESTPEEAVKLMKRYGYHGIEWRTVIDKGDTAKPGFWGGNRTTLQADWTDAQFRAVAEMTRNEGLEMPNLGSYASASDWDQSRRMIDVAAVMGIPSARINVTPYKGDTDYNVLLEKHQEYYGRVVEYAKPCKVRPVIEIHHGTIVSSASAARRFVSPWAPSDIGIIHDAGNMVHEGFENYRMGLEILGPYLAHVHIKNAVHVYEPADGPQRLQWKGVWAPLRTGVVNLADLMKALRAVGYDHWLSVEDFSTIHPQEAKVRDNIALLRELDIKGP